MATDGPAGARARHRARSVERRRNGVRPASGGCGRGYRATADDRRSPRGCTPQATDARSLVAGVFPEWQRTTPRQSIYALALRVGQRISRLLAGGAERALEFGVILAGADCARPAPCPV